ncbi:MAG: aspartate carbamoyltransferase regulatory subunit [Planctomycetota bacterium]
MKSEPIAERNTTPEKSIKVSALKQGTVIDHLRRGSALRVIRLLGISSDGAVTIGLNLESHKYGTKELIKIENRELTQEEVSKIALLSPEATFSIIRSFEVVHKFRPELPDVVEGLVRCSNPSCITNADRIRTRFRVLRSQPLRLRCHYCERAFNEEEVELF